MERKKEVCKICAKDNQEKFYTLSCNCVICDKCLTDKINMASGKKIIISKYEKSNFYSILIYFFYIIINNKYMSLIIYMKKLFT
jgi:hypothetical protein